MLLEACPGFLFPCPRLGRAQGLIAAPHCSRQLWLRDQCHGLLPLDPPQQQYLCLGWTDLHCLGGHPRPPTCTLALAPASHLPGRLRDQRDAGPVRKAGRGEGGQGRAGPGDPRAACQQLPALINVLMSAKPLLTTRFNISETCQSAGGAGPCRAVGLGGRILRAQIKVPLRKISWH